MHLRVHQPFHEGCRDRSIDRVPARLQHVDAGVDRKIGISGHGAVPADEARVERRRVGWRGTISSRGHADTRFSRRTEDRRSRFARRAGVAYRVLKNGGFVPAEVQTLNEIAQLERFVAADAGDDAAARAKALKKLALLRTRIES